MPLVVTCPACQQKARMPDAMLGQPVKCPACGATFAVPAAGPSTEAAPPVVPTDPPARLPLPADKESLTSVQAGLSVQLLTQCIYGSALALFFFLCMLLMADKLAVRPAGLGIGGWTGTGLLTVFAAVLLLGSILFDIVGASLCVLAPTAHLARGLAIAALILALVGFHQGFENLSWIALVFQNDYGRAAVPTSRFWVVACATLWLIEVVRLAVLALFWRAMNRILRDARGATQARRLAIGGPVVQVFLVIAWCMIAAVGAVGPEVEGLAFISWLAAHLMVVLAGVGIVARLRRRLNAALVAGGM
jgi:hypothetical protein